MATKCILFLCFSFEPEYFYHCYGRPVNFYSTPSPFSETSANSTTEVWRGFLLFRIQLGLSAFFFSSLFTTFRRYYSWNSNFQPHQHWEDAFSKVALRYFIRQQQGFPMSNRNKNAGYCSNVHSQRKFSGRNHWAKITRWKFQFTIRLFLELVL